MELFQTYLIRWMCMLEICYFVLICAWHLLFSAYHHEKFVAIKVWAHRDSAPNIWTCLKRTQWQRERMTLLTMVLRPPLMVLSWEQVSAPIWKARDLKNKTKTCARVLRLEHIPDAICAGVVVLLVVRK